MEFGGFPMPASPHDHAPIIRKPLLTAQLIGAKLIAMLE
jgi:hypothetical protein